MRHLGWFVLLLAVSGLGLTAPTRAQQEEAERLKEATLVLKELKDAPDVSVPKWVVEKAEAIAVFPSLVKAGFVVGGSRGHGVISVRDPPRAARGSSPAFLTITGGSIGFQIGCTGRGSRAGRRKNRRGLEQLLKNQFKIGADASVAAGPVGRDALRLHRHPDARADSELLTHARPVCRRHAERQPRSVRTAMPTSASTASRIPHRANRDRAPGRLAGAQTRGGATSSSRTIQ